MQFDGLTKFLAEKGQLPVSRKRRLVNLMVRFLGFLPVSYAKKRCDILYVLDSPILETRHQHIIEALQKRNLICKVIVSPPATKHLWAFIGALISKRIDFSKEYAYEQAVALYIKQWYGPAVIFQASDSSYMSTFLKRLSGAQLVNIAHCVSCPTKHFDFFDFHFNFLFGRSSVRNLKEIPLSFGRTQALVIGSLFLHDVNRDRVKSKIGLGKKVMIVYSSQWLPNEKSIRDGIIWSRGLVMEFAGRNRDIQVVIKSHPLESDFSWVENKENVQIASGNSDFREVLENAAFHVTHHSAFALEASIANVPTIVLQKFGEPDNCLHFKEYFPIVENVEEMERFIRNYRSEQYDIEGFVKLHLSNAMDPLTLFIDATIKIMNGEPLETEEINGTLFDN